MYIAISVGVIYYILYLQNIHSCVQLRLFYCWILSAIYIEPYTDCVMVCHTPISKKHLT